MDEERGTVLDAVLSILTEADEGKRQAESLAKSLEEEHVRAVAKLEREDAEERKAAVSDWARQRVLVNNRIKLLRREHDRRLKDAHDALSARVQKVEEGKRAAMARLQGIPPNYKGIFDSEIPDAPEAVHQESDYATAFAAFEDASLASRARELLSFGKGSEKHKAAREIERMVAEDVAYFEERKRLIEAEGASAVKRLGEDFERSRAELEKQLADIPCDWSDDGSLQRKRRLLDDMYQRRISEARAIALSSETFDAVGACRSLINEAAQALGCSPRQLKERTRGVSRFPEKLFACWLEVYGQGHPMLVPHAYSLARPRGMWFEKGEDEAELLGGLRSIVALQLKQCPRKWMRVDWIDPVTMGRSLGSLSGVATLSGPEDGRLLIRATTTATGVSERLTEITAELSAVSMEVAKEGSVWTKNGLGASPAIPQRSIVVYGLEDDAFSTTDLEALLAISGNASDCGVQLFIVCGGTEGCSDRKKACIERLSQQCERFEWEGSRYGLELEGGGHYSVRFQPDLWITDATLASLQEQEDPFETTKETFEGVLDQSTLSGIEIPFGVDERGRVVSLRFGTEYPHAFVTGVSGAGKSVFLHNVVESACMRYGQDELEIWLADYKKTEFGLYRDERCRYPQIGFLGLDQSMDFAEGFVALLAREYERRRDLAFEAGVQNIEAYNRRVGPEQKMRRLLVIIDEFHTQSFHMAQDGGRLRAPFERLLREVRAYGMHFLIADQAVSGLSGLTDEARKQISGRIMFAWSERSDVVDMFGVSPDDLGRSLKRGEAYVKSANGFTWCKSRFVDVGHMEESCAVAKDRYGNRQDGFLCYDANVREPFEGESSDASAKGSLRLGAVPDFANPVFSIELPARRRENVFINATQSDLALSIMYLIAYQAMRDLGWSCVAMADPDGYLYEQATPYLDALEAACGHVERLLSPEDASSYFAEDDPKDVLALFVGVEGMLEEMEDLPPAPRQERPAAQEDSFAAELAAFRGLRQKAESPSEGPFDVRPAILDFMRKGGRKNAHVCLVSNGVPSMSRLFSGAATYADDFDTLFAHRFSPKCGLQASLAMGMQGLADGILDDERSIKVAYADRDGKRAVFKPYAIGVEAE